MYTKLYILSYFVINSSINIITDSNNRASFYHVHVVYVKKMGYPHDIFIIIFNFFVYDMGKRIKKIDVAM